MIQNSIPMNSLALVSAILLLAGGLTACDTTIVDNQARSISAKIDGDDWRIENPAATRSTPPGTVSITAILPGSSKALYLTVKPTGPETISLRGGLNSGAYHEGNVQYLTALSGGSGTVTITEFNETTRRISGTFSFTAVNTEGKQVTITEGSFTNVMWTEQ